ncbi:aspartyl protease family protein [Oleiharenicola lentus]|uniref:retropepsin-like aspartic protease n=1 Tax=Oleiharenicola lentus TaxID=2508720 RepID=UPI003F67CBBA
MNSSALHSHRSLSRPILLRKDFILTLVALAVILFISGCSSSPFQSQNRGLIEPSGTVIPAKILSNFFLIETKWDDGRTYRFLVDTGSSTSLVSPEIAKKFGMKPRKGELAAKIRVRSAAGQDIELESVLLRRVRLGDSTFNRVAAVIFDCSEVSNHLGVTIDGILGFPLFRDSLLTLDYPNKRLILAPYPAAFAPLPKQTARVSTIAFNDEQNRPMIPLQMGNESFMALIDSGSDGSLNLNPVGLHPQFANGPRVGTLISSLRGNQRQLTGRLNQTVLIGTHAVDQPIVDLTEQLSSIGGEFLRHFAVTFDQRRRQVTFTRTGDGTITMEPRRSAGISFSRADVYWRVLSVIPDTPTAQLPVHAGDLCVRINGELVEKWTFERYAELLKTAPKVTFTFVNGAKETDLEIPVFELVP